jgi:hypothetical protein
LERDDINDVE